MRKAFSLIEVLVFITILAIFLVTAAAIITISLKQNTTKIHMLKATHYNQQLLDWLRSEREQDWSAFAAHADSYGKTYCFTDTVPSWSIASCGYALEGLFKRTVVVTSTGTPPTQVEIAIQTDWEEAGGILNAKLHSVFTLWE